MQWASRPTLICAWGCDVRQLEYSFDANDRIRDGTQALGYPAARLVFDGANEPTWLGPFRADERDLLRVMASVVEADRLSPRQMSDGRGGPLPLAWQRHMTLHLTVECPERWRAAAPRLERLLSFMTDDRWELDFAPVRTVVERQELLPFGDAAPVAEVALFSGGLDSVAGVHVRSRPTHRVVAVSASGNNVRRRALHDGLNVLREQGAVVRWVRLDRALRRRQARKHGSGVPGAYPGQTRCVRRSARARGGPLPGTRRVTRSSILKPEVPERVP
jgi:hypothetical protein